MDTIPQRSEGDIELNLHHLQVFDVLFTEHSLTKAARVLNLSQPDLSKTLARIREYLKFQIFANPGRPSLKGDEALHQQILFL